MAAALLVLVGCGRHGLKYRDAGAADSQAHPADALMADSSLNPADAPGGDASTGDGISSDRDVPSPWDARMADAAGKDALAPAAEVAVDVRDPAPFACAALRPLADKGLLTDRHVSQVLFAPDGKALLLLLLGAGTGDNNQAVLVSLPDGAQQSLGTGVDSAEWLGSDAVLLTTADVGLRVVSRAGKALRSLSRQICAHVAAPDGSRIYYVHDCQYSTGVLNVLDVATGTDQQLDVAVTYELAVSPDSRWAAYVGYGPVGDAESSPGILRVVEKGGTPYALPEQETTRSPMFLSDDLLVFKSVSDTYLSSTFWRHRPGTNETTRLGAGVDSWNAYLRTADDTAFLMAKFSSSTAEAAELDLVSVLKGTVTPLASDVLDFRKFQAPVQSFALSQPSQRAIYAYEARTGLLGFASVSLSGGGRVQLAPEASRALASPYGDRVAALASNHAFSATGNQITVDSPTTGHGQFVIVTDMLNTVTFLPGDTGLLFEERESDGSAWQLRHFSFADAALTTLGRWNTSKLMPHIAAMGIETATYPVDPTGCFTLVDTDLEPPGTRLVLLP